MSSPASRTPTPPPEAAPAAGAAGPFTGLRSLYAAIYLTVIAVLTVFALVAGLLLHRHAGGERGRIEHAVSDRLQAWAALLENSLPAATLPEAMQREALLAWSHRLRMPLALDDPSGRRLAVSPFYAERVGEDRARELQVAVPVMLSDGRVLWLLRSREDRAPRAPHLHVFDRGGPPGGPGGPPPPRPRPDRFGPRWLDDATSLLLLLGVLFVAVAVGAYPVVRRLTRRLETLQRGVERFGAGDLAHRVDTRGRDEVASVAASFNRAAQRIEDLVRSNRSLLANASHELRSPLTRLKMAVTMLDRADPVARASLRREIDRNIRELDDLVEEVLLASRLDARQGGDGAASPATEPIDLLGLLVEEAARVDVSADGVAATVQGEERLLRRALRNLLENARRYGGEEVEAEVVADGPDRVEVQVRDRGPGVPPEHRERVFEPFFRLPGHAERAGGVGLGLSLVRQIAQRHGGRASCRSREGGGSCFAISLPRAPADAVPGPGAPGPRSG